MKWLQRLPIILYLGINSTYAATVKVYAAASLSSALNDISKLYQKQYPNTKIIGVYGASSQLAKHIEARAPSDLFLSADQDWMQYLIGKNKVQANHVHLLLSNQLVLIQTKGKPIAFQPSAAFNFAQSLQGRLCTGQMESVPLGKYAKQSLSQLQWLSSLKGRIVEADDARAALAFVERGECRLGIVYKTDALMSHKMQIVGAFPTNSHHPIEYPIALTRQGQKNKAAQQFSQFLQTNAQVKLIFKRYGFLLPDKSLG
ncbi:molybdate ABC transporter substrate-binding protein [Acinetobacter lanii]|uniref:Molybdate ABC transporter substrate-binding protein n=1 Tax=Acinetobacter lanii TaxID=2715163 RepID=A0A6G8S461_9GAMM|nr:molybdate ABC transporter substrate-binding protein [Acinetobacter lanii]QIO09006.1 molybdate ABC transporter substrate-binding protein [Acinetobacter lanii]